MQPWVIANPHGILVDVQNEAWHAGRVYDMLSLGSGRILVASATGGVWFIDGAFNASPLSDDWEWPDMECLAFGPNGGNHIFAGGHGGLYETDPHAADPLHAWHPVALPRGSLPSTGLLPPVNPRASFSRRITVSGGPPETPAALMGGTRRSDLKLMHHFSDWHAATPVSSPAYETARRGSSASPHVPVCRYPPPRFLEFTSDNGIALIW